jgi:hypothetical protein
VQPIVPPVYRTGNPDLDRNFDAIATAFRRLNLGSGDHLVIVDKSDTPDTAENKVVQGSGVTVEKTGKPGDRQLTVSADVGGIVNEITNNETLVENISNSLTTNQTFITNVTNVTEVNATTPTQVATTLFPAEKNPDDRGMCTTVIDLNSTASGQVGWAQVDGQPGVYQRDTIGALPASFFDGVTPTITPAGCSLVGKRFLNINEKVASPPYTPVTFRNGPYILDDVGDRLVPNVLGGTEYHHEHSFARFHRAPGYTEGSEFIKGMTFQVQAGDAYGTDFFTLDTDQPITLGEGGTPQTWIHSEGPAHTWPHDKHLLCTAPELPSEGVSLAPQTAVGTIGGAASSDTTNPIDTACIAASALGITSIPAEPFEIDIASAYVAGLNYDSILTVGVQLWEVTPDGVSKVGAMIATGECTPLSNGTTTGIVFKATPSAVRSVSPTDKLMMMWTLHLNTTSTQATITVRISYGAPWGTKITVPWQMSVTGLATGNHQQLSARDQDVASADPVKADPCHPYNALGPAGRVFHKVDAGTMASNILTFPADASTCVVTLTADLTLDGIDATGFLPADTSVECPVSIVFVTGGHTLTVRSGQSVTSPAESIQLVTASGVTKSWGGTRRCRLQLVHNSATHTWDETSRSIY